jgi:hypothetical protein
MLAGSWAKVMNPYGYVKKVFGYTYNTAVSSFQNHIVETVELCIRRTAGISVAV